MCNVRIPLTLGLASLVAVMFLTSLTQGIAPAAASQDGGTVDFTGQWTCPGRGVMTLIQKDGKIVGTAAGDEKEDWAWYCKGMIINGIVQGRVARLTFRCGNGAIGTQYMTLSADGKSFQGEWQSTLSDGEKLKGTWQGSR